VNANCELFDKLKASQRILNSSCRRHHRLTKAGVVHLTSLIEQELSFDSGRGSPLTPLQQVCVTLSYFGGGTYQHTAGLLSGVSKGCANRTIKRVTQSICLLGPDVIKMPSRAEMRQSATFFNERLFSLLNIKWLV
jgi:hypothetical protein